ncbi:MAG: hypothetical protein H6826_06150 [Planctomycetes bacterium]|nr:hypothetical protein [Planctomycetota bacterium]
MIPVVALWDRTGVDADGVELLRWLVAALVAGRQVVVLDRAGADLEHRDLDGEPEALRDALRDGGATFRVAPLGSPPADLTTGPMTIHRLAPRDRPAEPPLLPWPPDPASSPDPCLSAGQLLPRLPLP